jgi:hypothetical protein
MMHRFRRPDVRQEEDTLPWARILLVAFAVIVIMVVLVLWAAAILRGREAVLRPSGSFPEKDIGPRREVSGVEERLFKRRSVGEEGAGQAENRRKREELSRFEWVDRERGFVRIPIEEAMELVAEEDGR